jgi:hypothetical protein
LQPRSAPLNIRPYRYPYAQKSDIEHMAQEMLEASIIQPSQSYFSSPVVMVCKKEGSWHMCLDYIEIDKMTIKYVFPILVIDELLDEFQGESFFTKLDIHYTCHQIRMRKKYIPKITFETHEGHYEFLVMLFGLTNAPSTFQSLINYILKPLLKKIVLVFFDDILIYNKSWEEHVQHVHMVLKLLEEKKPYENPSKGVEYLGNIVSHEGVKLDPNKSKAMMEWPIPKTLKNILAFSLLIDYYHEFIKNYGQIVAPLTTLLKRRHFLGLKKQP